MGQNRLKVKERRSRATYSLEVKQRVEQKLNRPLRNRRRCFLCKCLEQGHHLHNACTSFEPMTAREQGEYQGNLSELLDDIYMEIESEYPPP